MSAFPDNALCFNRYLSWKRPIAIFIPSPAKIIYNKRLGTVGEIGKSGQGGMIVNVKKKKWQTDKSGAL
jgi:hypothetical protein